jgi:hypothetical protein
MEQIKDLKDVISSYVKGEIKDGDTITVKGNIISKYVSKNPCISQKFIQVILVSGNYCVGLNLDAQKVGVDAYFTESKNLPIGKTVIVTFKVYEALGIIGGYIIKSEKF